MAGQAGPQGGFFGIGDGSLLSLEGSVSRKPGLLVGTVTGGRSNSGLSHIGGLCGIGGGLSGHDLAGDGCR